LVLSQRASRAQLTVARLWQNTLTLNGLSVIDRAILDNGTGVLSFHAANA
jgi:hypothetical protein